MVEMTSRFVTQSDGALDLVSLGALVIRLDPGVVPFRKAREVQIHVSGGEYNVAANLADCFGLRTAMVSAMVDYPIGDRVAEQVRAAGVRGIYRTFAHDGVTGPNIATVYSDRGQGMRAPVVFYNRANEAAALLRPGDFDWGEIFVQGVRWFHSGGIFASLSETTADLVVEGMRAARLAGATVSFDLNYREKLWGVTGGRARAQAQNRRIVELVDVLLGNEEDLQCGLGIPGPEGGTSSRTDPLAYSAMIDRVVGLYPHLRVVATTLRTVDSANRHSWGAVARIQGETYVSPTCELDVLDRVGGGDGFASGLFYGLIAGESPADAVRLGWAHGALLTTYPGDTTMATAAQVRSLASGESARVQR
jgi:2-dehydro-3-deoxygluconokinase